MDKETGSFWNCSLQKAVKQLIVRRVQILAETPDRPLVLPSLLIFPKSKIRSKLIRIMVEIKMTLRYFAALAIKYNRIGMVLSTAKSQMEDKLREDLSN